MAAPCPICCSAQCQCLASFGCGGFYSWPKQLVMNVPSPFDNSCAAFNQPLVLCNSADQNGVCFWQDSQKIAVLTYSCSITDPTQWLWSLVLGGRILYQLPGAQHSPCHANTFQYVSGCQPGCVTCPPTVTLTPVTGRCDCGCCGGIDTIPDTLHFTMTSITGSLAALSGLVVTISRFLPSQGVCPNDHVWNGSAQVPDGTLQCTKVILSVNFGCTTSGMGVGWGLRGVCIFAPFGGADAMGTISSSTSACSPLMYQATADWAGGGAGCSCGKCQFGCPLDSGSCTMMVTP